MRLRTQLAIGYMLVFAMMAVVATVAYWNIGNLLEAQKWDTHTHQVMTAARLIERHLVDMQTGKRGFQLTGEENYLEPCERARKALATEMPKLKELVSDNPSQVERLDEIEALVKEYQEEVLTPHIEMRRKVVEGTVPMEAVLEDMKDRGYQEFMAKLREKTAAFMKVEEDLSGGRETVVEAAAFWSVCVILGGTVVAILFGIMAMLLSSRGIFRLVGGEPAAIAEVTGQIAQGNLDIKLEGGTGIRASVGAMLEALRESRARTEQHTASLHQLSSELETIMDSIPGLVFYKDTQNCYLRVNKFVADAHGMKKEDLEGRDLFDLYPREQAQAYLDDDLEVINSGQAKLNIDEPWETEKGTRWVTTSKIPYVNENGEIVGVIGVSMDVTERRQAEDALRKQSEELEKQSRIRDAINRVFRNALTCETEDDVAKTALRVAEELTGSSFGFIGEINTEGRFDTIGLSNPGWTACAIEGSSAALLIKGMALRGIWATVLKTGAAHIVNDPSTHPDRVGTPEGHPALTCFLGVPFKREDKTVGMIALANKEGGYSQDDQEAIEALAAPFYEALVRKRAETELEQRNWVQAGQARLNDEIRGEKDIATLTCDVIACLADYVGAQVGALFLEENGRLKLRGRYAYRKHAALSEEFAWGEGLVGQAAADMKPILLSGVPEDYVVVGSALGQTAATNILVVPFLFDSQVTGVIELASLEPFSELHREFLSIVADAIAIGIVTAQARDQLKALLEETQRQAEELQAQQEELKTSNEELEEQTERLKASEERLKAQQEEMEVTNEELLEKNELLERQKREVEAARKAIQEKAEEVALASKYKSEFLSNMSHELRTPLNSLLILAQSLAQNKEGNLTEDQVESARIIYGGGNDLLNLINEILDLSKIEAGRMEFRLGAVPVAELAHGVQSAFRHVAEEKGLCLAVNVEDGSPVELSTDRQRLEQILRNLVSNAIKFTEEGSVTVAFGRPAPDTDLSRSGLSASDCLAVEVKDTGIGISPEQQKIVFEAFQQADTGTSRKYGGTGLGLSISRELARLLGGEIRLESEPDQGSVFSLYLPVTAKVPQSPKGERGTNDRDVQIFSRAGQSPVADSHAQVSDDRENLADSDKTILVIEDDAGFAKVLCDKCHDRGFKCLAAPTGEAGLELAARHVPDGMILDMHLPGMDGWGVLDALKDDIRTRHIPVHIVSAEEATTESLRRGAIGHATKPLDEEQLERAFKKIEQTSAEDTKRVLIVEDDEGIRRSVKHLIEGRDVTVDEAATGKQAIEALRTAKYGCLILDLELPDMGGGEILRKMVAEGAELPPIIVHTARDLTEEQEMDLREHAESIVIKDVRSQERLLDEVSLFLHRVVGRMPEKKKQVIRNLHEAEVLLNGKKVLIVDDDMRTSFAVSRLLSERGMIPVKAKSGEQALQVLATEPGIDLVLMDIMMPMMDGYETMKRIREQDEFRKLPIIALTAKAMPQDRRKCIDAGANDYLSKPIDQQRLISMMRVWLYR